MRADSWSRRCRRSTVRSSSMTEAARTGARFARGFSLSIMLMSASAEVVAGELAAAAPGGALGARLSNLDDRGRQLHTVLRRGLLHIGVACARSARLGFALLLGVLLRLRRGSGA